MAGTVNLPLGNTTLATFAPVVIGGGGLTTHLSISKNGQTILVDGDVNGVWLLNTTANPDRWESLQTITTGAALYQGTKNPGLYQNQQGPSDVRVALNHPDYIYYFHKPAGIDASVSKARIMRSTNRGRTFSACPGYLSDHYTDSTGSSVLGGNTSSSKYQGPKIGIDPSDPNVIYVPWPGTGFKPKMSVNGGKTFTEIAGLPTQVAQTVGAASWAIDPTSSIVDGRHQRIICYMDKDGIYETTNGGTSWTKIKDVAASSLTDAGAAFGPDGAYFIALNNDGVWRYMSGTWTEVVDTASNCKVAVHPTIAGRIAVLIPGSQLKHSTNHGTNFTNYATSGLTFTSNVPWQQSHQNAIKFGGGNVRQIAWNAGVTDEIWVNSAQGVCRGTLNSSAVSTFEVVVLGTEELVGNEVVSIEGKNHINVFSWDEFGFKKINSISGLADPPSDKNGPPAIAGWVGNLYNGWQACVDPQNTDLVVVCGNKRFPFTMDGNGYSQNGGDTWNNYANNPTMPAGTGQWQMVCVNDGVTLFIPGHNSSNTILPQRSADLGATAWTQLTLANFPGHTGAADAGFSTGLQTQLRMMAPDGLDPDTFYINNMHINDDGIWRSTDRGQNFTHLSPGTGTRGSGTPLSNPWYNNGLVYGKVLKSVIGYEGLLFMCGPTTSGPNFPPSGYTFVKSTNGGESWVVVDPDILMVENFGFGKARLPGGDPTIFFTGFYKGFWGLYRMTDFDPATIKRYVSSAHGRWPLGIHNSINGVTGDMNVYGRVYLAHTTHGFTYADAA